MSTIILALQDLSCAHCVKNLQQKLQALAGVQNLLVTLDFAKVETELEPAQLIACVQQAGYGASLAQPSFELALHGLSCGHCVRNVEKILNEQGVQIFQVSKTYAQIYGNAEPENLIKAIVAAGYEAELASPKPNLLSESADIPAPAQNPDPQIVASLDQEMPEIRRLRINPMDMQFEQEKVLQENAQSAQVHLLLQGLSCAACVAKVEKALLSVEKVEQASVNLAQSSAMVQGNAEVSALIKAVQQAGFQAELVEDEELRRQKQQQQAQQEIRQRRWQGISALLLGAILMAWGLLGGTMSVTPSSQAYWLAVGLLTLACMYFCGGHFYRRAWQALRHKTANMDTLVALGTGVAWLYSMLLVLQPEFFPEHARHLYFEASAMILGFINLGKMLESKGKQRSSQALSHLLDLNPAKVRWVTDKGMQEIPLAQVKPGMLLHLQEGDLVGVDGELEQGEAWLDESSLTGEPLAVFKQKGDLLRAGTMVQHGAGFLRAKQVGNQTMLAQIIKLVRQAQSSKPQLALLADKISAIFVPTVLLIALSAGLIWYWLSDFSHAFVIFTTVLIIACPCALGLATPMSIIAAVGRAAELGILVREADALEKVAQAKMIVLDKTGTLTQGKARVVAMQCFNGFSQKEVLQLAASLEMDANHPLAKAILELAEEQGISLWELDQFQTHQGLGVTGRIGQQELLLGNASLLAQKTVEEKLQKKQAHFSQMQDVQDWAESQAEQGATVVYFAIREMGDSAESWQLAATFAIRDELRQDSIQALRYLQTQGYQLIMLTGDQRQTAQAIAKQAGIEHVVAEVLPADKAAQIQLLQQQGHKVIMVGDGINDTPALAQADVSFAMGTGADVAIETASITLMRPSIQSLAQALSLAKASWRNMRQNLFAAFVYNCLGIPIAAGLLYPIFGILLNPMWAGAAMALSSITVVTNANRLLRFVPKN